MVTHLLPILTRSFELARSFEESLPPSHLCFQPVWRRIALHLRHPRKLLSPQWVLIVCFSGVWDVSSPWSSVSVWRGKQLLCWLSGLGVFFWSWIATDNHMQSKLTLDLLCFERSVSLGGYLLEKLLIWLFPIKCVQTRETPCRLLKKIRVDAYYELRRGEHFWSERHRCIGFLSDCFFWSGIISTMRPNSALLKLASVIRTSCLLKTSCFSANSQALLSALLIVDEVKCLLEFWT